MTEDVANRAELLTAQDAACYCGMSVEEFEKKCPARLALVTPARRGRRYLRDRLDAWLASLRTPEKEEVTLSEG